MGLRGAAARWVGAGIVAAGTLGVGVSGAQTGAQTGTPTGAGAGVQAAVKTGAPKGDLRILFADVEGGQATLFVTPAGKSLLIDTGWPGNNGRDADRILALCKRAGVTKIDDVLITHFHDDHVGGFAQLAARIPIGQVIDHGRNTETTVPATVANYQAYQQTLAEKRIPRMTAQIGEVLPIAGMRVEVVSSNGGVMEVPLHGVGTGEANAACARSPEKALENSENDRSVGVLITFGKLRVLDLGDLTWAMERSLVCPVNKLGRVDVFVVSHHGTERSNSPALVAGIQPRVAVMDNGPHKGGEVGTFETLDEPDNGVGVLWQMHAAEGVQANLQVPQERMANRAGEDGHWLEVDGAKDGAIQVTNGRTGEVVRYAEGEPGHRS